jgi:DNA-binding CsgD family transcriptional regulator
VKTVDTHRSQIKKKLGLKNNTELVHHATRWAAEKG